MIKTQILKHLPGARSGERGGSKGDVRGGAIDNGVMKTSRNVRVIEGEEVGGDDPIKYLLFTRVGSTSRIMWFLEEERMERKRESVLPSVEEKRIGGA